MVHRIAIVAGASAAAVVLVISLAAASFNGGGGSGAATAAAALQPAADAASAPLVQTVTDTVYVKPVPAAKIIHVTKPAPASASYSKPIVIVKHVASHGSGGDGGAGDD